MDVNELLGFFERDAGEYPNATIDWLIRKPGLGEKLVLLHRLGCGPTDVLYDPFFKAFYGLAPSVSVRDKRFLAQVDERTDSYVCIRMGELQLTLHTYDPAGPVARAVSEENLTFLGEYARIIRIKKEFNTPAAIYRERGIPEVVIDMAKIDASIEDLSKFVAAELETAFENVTLHELSGDPTAVFTFRINSYTPLAVLAARDKNANFHFLLPTNQNEPRFLQTLATRINNTYTK